MKINNVQELMEYITEDQYILNNDMEKLIADCYSNGDNVEEYFTLDEDGESKEIYQYFITSWNDNLEKYLELQNGRLPVYYIEKYDLTIVGMTIFGMSWKLAEENIDL